MNKGRVILGALCLAGAMLLTVLYLVLPTESTVVEPGQENWRWVGVGVVVIVGIWLLATAGIGRLPAPAEPGAVVDPAKAALNKRLETFAWGCGLVLFGAYILLPHTDVTEGLWSVAVGAILLGLNGARYLNHLKMSGFTTFLGIAGVIGGIVQAVGLSVISGALFFIILGVCLLARLWLDQFRLFGKAEEA